MVNWAERPVDNQDRQDYRRSQPFGGSPSTRLPAFTIRLGKQSIKNGMTSTTCWLSRGSGEPYGGGRNEFAAGSRENALTRSRVYEQLFPALRPSQRQNKCTSPTTLRIRVSFLGLSNLELRMSRAMQNVDKKAVKLRPAQQHGITQQTKRIWNENLSNEGNL